MFFSAHWFLINQKSLASVWSELLYIPSFVLWIGIEIRYNVVGISGILFGCLLPNDGIGSLKLDFYVQKSMKEICWIILIFLPYVCYSWWFYSFFKVEKLPKIGIRYFEDLVHPHVRFLFICKLNKVSSFVIMCNDSFGSLRGCWWWMKEQIWFMRRLCQ